MTGKYNTIVIDPPWEIGIEPLNLKNHKAAPKLPYKTMTLDEIKQFPLKDFAAVGAHVYCWTTNKMLDDSFDVLKAWGVKFHIMISMVKDSGLAPAMGYVFASEYCLLGFFGQPMQKFIGIGALNWIRHRPVANQHSRKPRHFYTLVEKMSPPPKN